MKFKKNQRLEIFWLDAKLDPRWHSEEEALIPADTCCQTIGYYLCEDENCIIVSPTIGPNGERDPYKIIKGAITKIIKLEARG